MEIDKPSPLEKAQRALFREQPGKIIEPVLRLDLLRRAGLEVDLTGLREQLVGMLAAIDKAGA